MSTITIQKEKIKGGVVILPLREYRKLLERVVPVYHLRGKAAERLDASVRRALRDYREGKTRIIRSLADLR